MYSRGLFFLRIAFSALVRSVGVTVLAVLTTAVSLTVLATFVVIVRSLARASEDLGSSVEISVYLSRDVVGGNGEEMAAEARRWSEVAGARFLTAGAAMSEFRASLGRDAILLEGLPNDLLPPSLEIVLSPRTWTSEEVQQIARRFEGRTEVEDIRYGQDDLERIAALFSFTRLVAIVLGASLCFATVLIVSNTIRLTVYARRDEIEILSLVGATGWFVRAPFIVEGAVQGLLGGAASGAVLLGFGEVLRLGIERGLSYAYGPVSLDFVPLEYLGYLVAAGAALGLIGSVLAVGKFLKP